MSPFILVVKGDLLQEVSGGSEDWSFLLSNRCLEYMRYCAGDRGGQRAKLSETGWCLHVLGITAHSRDRG